jgi:hypothetical protein
VAYTNQEHGWCHSWEPYLCMFFSWMLQAHLVGPFQRLPAQPGPHQGQHSLACLFSAKTAKIQYLHVLCVER